VLGVSAMACTSVCKAREEEEIKAFMVFAINGWISLIEFKDFSVCFFAALANFVICKHHGRS
jgi:hypothetical protein